MIANFRLNVKSISAIEAIKSNLRSMSAWKKRGRDVAGEPTAYVVNSTKRTIGPILPWHLQLEQLGENLFLVADEWYGVYPVEQTVEKSPIESSNVHLESKYTSTRGREEGEVSSPFVSQTPHEDERKSKTYKALTSRKKASKIESTKHRVNNAYWSYIPALSDHDIQALGDDIGKASLLFHLLYIFRFLGDSRKRSDDWIDLSAQYMKTLMGWQNWTYIRDKLLALNILEPIIKVQEDTFGLGIEQQRGVKGGLCYGYRLREDLRRSIHKKYVLNDQTAQRWLDRFLNTKKKRTVHKCLERLLLLVEMLSVDDDYLKAIAARKKGKMTIDEKVEYYKQQIRAIQNGEWWLKVDDETGRVFTPITCLKRELRQFLRIQGQPLVQLDVKCCQPLLVGYLARKAGYIDERYIQMCEKDLYQYLADKLHIKRDQAKQELTQGGLFASNTSWHQRSKTMKLFKQEFPVIWQYITDIKSYTPKKDDSQETKDRPHRVLAIKAQRAEAKIVIEGVCERLRKEYPGMFFTTIHDSILSLKKDQESIKVVIEDEFAKLNLHPTLHME